MKKSEVKEKLKTLKQVKPDKDFVEGTRRLILTTKPERSMFAGFPKWVLSVSGAALILLVSVLITGSLQSEKPNLSSLDSKDLQKELESLSVEVEEINYPQEETNRTIASALNEISSSQGSHLNKEVLEKEINEIQNIEEDNDEKINKLLNRVIF